MAGAPDVQGAAGFYRQITAPLHPIGVHLGWVELKSLYPFPIGWNYRESLGVVRAAQSLGDTGLGHVRGS